MMAIAPAKFDPRPEYAPFARGVAKGAGKGAVAGMAGGAYVGFKAPAELLAGPDTGWIALLILPFTVAAGAAIGTVAGTVGGTATAVPEATARHVDDTIAAAIAALKAPQAVGRSVMEELSRSTTLRLEWMPEAGADGPDGGLEIASLRSGGADAAVDVQVQAIGFEGSGGVNPTLALIVRASAKLVRVYDDSALPGPIVTPVYRSALHPFTEWAAEDAKLLQDELRHARAALADYIVEQVVLIPAAPKVMGEPACGPDPLPPVAATPSSLQTEGSTGRQVPAARPSLQSKSTGGGVRTGSGKGTVHAGKEVSADKASVNAIEIHSDKVILRWEQYPSERQRGLEHGDLLDAVQDTVYDLKVWTMDRFGVPSEVYDRRGIAKTSHPIELPLKPGPIYFWSVRARFQYRGRDAATPWSGAATSQDPDCAAFPFPDSRRFQFRTAVD